MKNFHLMGISLYRNRDFTGWGTSQLKSGDPMKETGIEARDHTLPDLLVRSAYDTYFRTNSWSFLPFVLIMPFLPPCSVETTKAEEEPSSSVSSVLPLVPFARGMNYEKGLA